MSLLTDHMVFPPKFMLCHLDNTSNEKQIKHFSNRKSFNYSKQVLKGEQKMKYKVVISEGEDGWYVVECPSIPGCISQGRTIEEALDNIKDAIYGCLEVMNERIKIQGNARVMEVTV